MPGNIVVHDSESRRAKRGSDDADKRDRCAACDVPIDRYSNYLSLTRAWERRALRPEMAHITEFDPNMAPVADVEEATEIAIFCGQECLDEWLKRGSA